MIGPTPCFSLQVLMQTTDQNTAVLGRSHRGLSGYNIDGLSQEMKVAIQLLYIATPVLHIFYGKDKM